MTLSFCVQAVLLYLLLFLQSVSFRLAASMLIGLGCNSCLVLAFVLLCTLILSDLLVSKLNFVILRSVPPLIQFFLLLFVHFILEVKWFLEFQFLFKKLFEVIQKNHSCFGLLKIVFFFSFWISFLLMMVQ